MSNKLHPLNIEIVIFMFDLKHEFYRIDVSLR